MSKAASAKDAHPTRILSGVGILGAAVVLAACGSSSKPAAGSAQAASSTGSTAASSARLYWESFRSIPSDPVTVPVGCSIFPKEIFRPSRRWAQHQYPNIVYWEELDRGGHFAVLENPDAVVGDLRAFFGSAG